MQGVGMPPVLDGNLPTRLLGRQVVRLGSGTLELTERCDPTTISGRSPLLRGDRNAGHDSRLAGLTGMAFRQQPDGIVS